jgi:hypothetical protein
MKKGSTGSPFFYAVAAVLIFQPSKLVKALGLPFVCLAMFSIAGGHWAILQSVAWGQLLWTYSQEEGSVVTGAEKTFSGEYPCEMCRKVAEGQKQEQKAPATLKVDKKAEKSLVAFSRFPLPPDVSDFVFHLVPCEFSARAEAPPVPVPIV